VYHKPYQQPTHGRSKLQNEASEPGDELQGDYTRERLLQMDARFRERLERAIAHGKERPPVPPLTDQQLEILRALATPLRPAQRPLFVRQVLQRLHGITELGDGAVAQAAREAQAEIRKAAPWLQA
jgi:hypothetical protein